MPSPKNPRRHVDVNNQTRRSASQRPCSDMRKRAGSQPGFDVTIPLFVRTNQQQIAHYPTNHPTSVNLSPRAQISLKNEPSNQENHSPVYTMQHNNWSPFRHHSIRVQPGSQKDTVPTLTNYTINSVVDSLQSSFFERNGRASDKSSASDVLPQNSIGDKYSNRSSISNTKRRPSSSPPHSIKRPSQLSNASDGQPLRPGSAASAFQPLMSPLPSVTQQANQSQASSASVPAPRNASSNISNARSSKKKLLLDDRQMRARADSSSCEESKCENQNTTKASSSRAINEVAASSYFTALLPEQLRKSK